MLRQASAIRRHLHSLNTRIAASFCRFVFAKSKRPLFRWWTQASDPRGGQDRQVTPPICWPSIPLSLS